MIELKFSDLSNPVPNLHLKTTHPPRAGAPTRSSWILVISEIIADLENIKVQLQIKDMEIDLLNIEVKSAYTNINQLKQKI